LFSVSRGRRFNAIQRSRGLNCWSAHGGEMNTSRYWATFPFPSLGALSGGARNCTGGGAKYVTSYMYHIWKILTCAVINL
jgi:hypothetical protein